MTTESKQADEAVWLPLECNPDVWTQYLQMLSLTDYYLIDVPVIDGAEEMGIFAGHHVKAFIVIYEINEKTETCGDEDDRASAITTTTSTGTDTSASLFYMKQLIKNSCGSVALVHAYLNTVDRASFEPASILSQFYEQAINETDDPIRRGELFAANSAIKDLHHQFACQGQTAAPSDERDLENVRHHFVAIVPFGGQLYELDGRSRCGGPIARGSVADEAEFKRCALVTIQRMIERDPDNVNFACLAFCGK